MLFARARKGTQRVTHDGREYVLSVDDWTELPADLAKSIAPHANIEVSDRKPTATTEAPQKPREKARGSDKG